MNRKKLSLKKKLLFSAILFAVCGIVLLGLFEIGLRIREAVKANQIVAQSKQDPESVPTVASEIPGLHYRLKPDFQVGEIKFNEHGFNMPSRSQEKPSDVYRIMVIGDSVTQGTGTTRTSQAFPNQMETLLADVSVAGKRLEIWNCGVAGYNAEQVLVVLKEVLPPFSPDMVIYHLNFNDYWPPSTFFAGHVRNGATNDDSESSKAGLLDTLKKIRTVDFAKSLYDDFCYWKNGYMPVFVDMKIDYPGWKHMKKQIAEMKRVCQERGFSFAVGIHPREQFLHRPDESNLAHRDLVTFMKDQSITVFDPTAAMRKRKSEDLYIIDGDHCTPRGYEVLAKALADELRQRLTE